MPGRTAIDGRVLSLRKGTSPVLYVLQLTGACHAYECHAWFSGACCLPGESEQQRTSWTGCDFPLQLHKPCRMSTALPQPPFSAL